MRIFDRKKKVVKVFDAKRNLISDYHNEPELTEAEQIQKYKDEVLFQLNAYPDSLRTYSAWLTAFNIIEDAENMYLDYHAPDDIGDFSKTAIDKVAKILFDCPFDKIGHMKYSEVEIGAFMHYILRQFVRFFDLKPYDQLPTGPYSQNPGEIKTVSVNLQKASMKQRSDSAKQELVRTGGYPDCMLALTMYLDAFQKKYSLATLSASIFRQKSDMFTHTLVRDEQPYIRDFVILYCTLVIGKKINLSIPMLVRILASSYFVQEQKEFAENILYENPKTIDDFIRAFIGYSDSWEKHIDEFKAVLVRSKIPIETIENIESRISDFQRTMKLESFEESLLSGNSDTEISSLDIKDGKEFEEFLQRLFEKMGFQCELTKYTGDKGADLVISKMGKRTVVQAKRYSEKVGNSAIQEAVTAIKPYRATNAMVVTTNYFTESARELANSNNVELVDRAKLEKWLKRYHP